MVPCLSHFPSLCLESILKYVPLVELLRSLGLVCTSFHAARHTDLNRRRRLVIVQSRLSLEGFYRRFFISPYELDLIERVQRENGSPWHRLESLEQMQFDALTLPKAFWTAPTLANSPLMHLPNITQLVLIVDHKPTALPQLVRIIGHCSRQLVELKLHLMTIADDDQEATELEQNMANLFACLDDIASLRHVRMNLWAYRFRTTRSRMVFLSRLESFAMSTWDKDGRIEWILSELADHHGTGTIELHECVLLANLLALVNTRLDGYFRHLSVFPEVLGTPATTLIGDFRRFCARFNQLTVLSLVNWPMAMPDLARHLSQLHQLVQLSLSIRGEPQVEQPQPELQPKIAQVPSLRLLILHITTRSHRYTEQLFIAEIFPGLQVLRLQNDIRECVECGIVLRLNIKFESDRLAECWRLARLTFWRAPNLHTIQPFYGHPSDRLITASEL